jgi:hypothetical protein
VSVAGGVLSILVSWVPASFLGDGGITDATGFKVYWDTTSRYGEDVSAYANSAVVFGGAASSYTIASLVSGTYYVVVTATNAAGEGPPDAERTITI